MVCTSLADLPDINLYFLVKKVVVAEHKEANKLKGTTHTLASKTQILQPKFHLYILIWFSLLHW